MPKKKSYKQIMKNLLKPKSKVKPIVSPKANIKGSTGGGHFKKVDKI